MGDGDKARTVIGFSLLLPGVNRRLVAVEILLFPRFQRKLFVVTPFSNLTIAIGRIGDDGCDEVSVL